MTDRPGAGDKLRDVPVEERTSRTDRCTQHPGAASVARCDGCGRSLCLTCAIPVRGLVLGTECLAQVLGEDAPVDEPSDTRRLGAPAIAFLVATTATVAPWTTLGDGSGPLGAWSRSPRWSLLAALAAVAGVLVEAVARRLAIGTVARDVADIVLGLAVFAGSVLAWFRPPFPADSVATPWIAAAAGAIAAAAAAVDLRGHVRRRS